MCRTGRGGLRTPSLTIDETNLCVFVENALFYNRSLILQGQERIIDLLTRPDISQLDQAAAAGKKEAAAPQLSRREREEIEKQRAKARYQKLHAEGKTDEAKADLARLAIIRKQREDAEKKRKEEAAGKTKSNPT